MFATLLVAIGISTGNLGFISLNEDHCSDIPECLTSRIFVHRDERHLEDLWQDLGVGIDTEIRVQVNDSLSRPLVSSNWTDLRSNLYLLPRQAWIGKTQLNCKNWQTNGDYPEQCFVGTVSQGLPQSCNKLRTVYCACRVFGITQPPTLSPSWSTPTTSPSMSPSMSPVTSKPSMSPITTKPSSSPTQKPTTQIPTKSPTPPTTLAPSASPSYQQMYFLMHGGDAGAPLAIAEVQFFPNSDPLVAISPSVLQPTATQKTTSFPTTQFNATIAVDGITAGNGALGQVSRTNFCAGILCPNWWQVMLPVKHPSDLFRIALWMRTDTQQTLLVGSATLQLQYDATTPTFVTPIVPSLVWSGLMAHVNPPNQVFYYPSADYTTSNLFLSIESTTGNRTMQLVEIVVTMKSQWTINALVITTMTGPSSGALALDGVYTNSSSWIVNSAYMQVFLGNMAWQEIDQIQLYHPLSSGASLVDCSVVLRSSNTFGYQINVSDTSNIVWSWPIKSIWYNMTTLPMPYRPLDVEWNRWITRQDIYGSYVAGADYFGMTIAVNQDETVKVSSGQLMNCIWIHKRYGTQWIQHQDPICKTDSGAEFGYRVAIWDTTIIVLSDWLTQDPKINVIELNQTSNLWYYVTTLIGVDTVFTGIYGSASISIYNDTIVQGITSASNFPSVPSKLRCGAFVFKRNSTGNWNQDGGLIYSDDMVGGAISQFADVTVDIWENTIAIGLLRTSGTTRNYVAVFTRNDTIWYQDGSLLSDPDVASSGIQSAFGASISLGNNTLLVGTLSQITSQINNGGGSVIVYNRVNGVWIPIQRVVGSNAPNKRSFGIQISLWRNYFAVASGIYQFQDISNHLVYIFRLEPNGLWREVRRLAPICNLGYMYRSDTVFPYGNIVLRDLAIYIGGGIATPDGYANGNTVAVARDSYPTPAPTTYPSLSPVTQQPSNAPSASPTTSSPSISPTTSQPSNAPSFSPTMSITFLSIETPTIASSSLQIVELQVYLKSDPDLNIILNSPESRQSSTVQNSSNAINGNFSDNSQTVTQTSIHWWAIPLGLGFDYTSIDRIVLNGLANDDVLTSSAIRIRSLSNSSSVFDYYDTLRIVWEFGVGVQIPSNTYSLYYRPTDTESDFWNTEVRITGSGRYGSVVAVNQNETIMVVIKNQNFYIYMRSGFAWLLHQPAISTGRNAFGSDIAIWDSTIVLACSFIQTRVFDYNGTIWVETESIPVTGYKVSIYENTVAIGDYQYGDNVNGAVWVYRRLSNMSWIQLGDIIQRPQPLLSLTQFGHRVSIWNNTIAVASFDGYVWVLDYLSNNSWVDRFNAKYDYYTSVTLYQEWLAIGDSYVYAGDVKMYYKNGDTWTFHSLILGSNTYGSGGLGSSAMQGWSVSIWNDYMVVGAKSNLDVGSVYIFKYNGTIWKEVRHLTGSGTIGDDTEQGSSVVIRNISVYVGGPGDNGNFGALWIFYRNPTPPPTGAPSQSPVTSIPSKSPSISPTTSPTTSKPSTSPSTSKPSISPSMSPSYGPTLSKPSRSPSLSPSTSSPSQTPTSSNPSGSPSRSPSFSPSTSRPSRNPTISAPSGTPTRNPTTPTTQAPTSSPSSTSMFVSLERPSLTNGYINVAEMQIFMNSNPNTALAAPTLMPSATMSSRYSGGNGPSIPDTSAFIGVDGSTAGLYNPGGSNSQLAFTNNVVERSWWRVQIPGTSYRLEDIFRLAYWGRTDGCCATEMYSQSVQVRVRTSAVTDPSSSSGLLYSKQMYNFFIGWGVYYYPNSQFTTQDIYMSLERPTFSPTQATIQINELRVYMKSQPTINIAQGYNILGQESTLSPSFPASNAVDGNVATFSHTSGGGGLPWWIQYLGSMYYGDIDRIEFVNRDCCESMVDAWLRLRTDISGSYSPNPLDTSNVVWQFQIKVISTTTSFAHTYRPVDVENTRWVTQQKIVGATSVSKFGYSVAMNQNESVMVVGGPAYNSDQGAIWIYHRIGLVWFLHTGPRQATGISGTSYQGVSVDIFDSTIVVGASAFSSNAGSAVVYEYDGISQWYQKQILSGTGASATAQQGTSVSIHGDTIAVGGAGDSSSVGATWIFVRNSSGLYTQQGSKLVGTAVAGIGLQGYSVSLWGDSVAIGGPLENTNTGAVWVFTRSAGTWSQQGSKITASGSIGTSTRFGFSVSLQRDILVVGAQTEHSTGAVYFLTRSGSTWTQQQRLVGSNPLASQLQGSSVYIWNNYVAMGAVESSGVGSVYIYRQETSTTWREVRHVTGTGNVGNSAQGRSICLRNTTIVFGGDMDNSQLGAVWMVLRDPGPTLTNVPSKSPTTRPTLSPTSSKPSVSPSQSPSRVPTSSVPSVSPSTSKPSISPSTSKPSVSPSRSPSRSPSTSGPSVTPSFSPSTNKPSRSPSRSPTTPVGIAPSRSPTTPTTRAPSSAPSLTSLFLSLETTTVSNNPIEVAELAIYTNSNPGSAISSPTLTPTVVQSSNFSPTQFLASVAVDGVTAGVAASDQVAITGAVSERAWLRVQIPGSSLVGPDHLFKIVLWPRTDVCCRYNLRDRNVRLRLRYDAVTDPSSSTSILLDKQIQVQYEDQPMNFYPSKDFTPEDLYLTIERTSAPTASTIDIMELEVYMKSQPTVNIISGFTLFCTQDSEFPGFPCSNALDGSYSTFSATSSTTAQKFWSGYIGTLAWQDIDRINLYFRTAGNSISGAFVRLRSSTSTIPYNTITVSDTTNVRYSFTLVSVSSVDTIPLTFRPYGIEELRWTRQIKHIGTNPINSRIFGSAMAINQNESVAIIGSPSYSGFGGRVYVYHRNESSNQWVQQGTEFRSSTFTGTTVQQGISVAVYDSTIVWAGTGDSSGAGRGYIWQWDGVSAYYEVANFSPSGICTTTACSMGTGTAIWGNYVAFGARLDVGGEGSILIYKKTGSTWAFQVRLTQSDGLTGNLGTVVAMHENTLVSGGQQRNTLRGAVWVFVRDPNTDTWAQQGSVLIPTGLVETSSQLRCGRSVSIFSDWLATGCISNLNNVGAVVMYNRTSTTWTQRQIIIPSSPIGSFGSSVNIWNDYMVAGGNGAAYIFRLVSGTWIEVRRITSIGGVGTNNFGVASVIRNRTALISATGDSAGVGTNTGAFWVVYRDP